MGPDPNNRTMQTIIPTMKKIMLGLRSVETKDGSFDIIMKAVYGPIMGK